MAQMVTPPHLHSGGGRLVCSHTGPTFLTEFPRSSLMHLQENELTLSIPGKEKSLGTNCIEG
jgi:hypothetical protein